MKKKIFWILLCVFMIIPTFAFFGCNNNSSSKAVFENLQETVASFDETDSPLNATSLDATNGYKLKDFNTKNSSDNPVPDDQNYIYLNAAAIKYIKNSIEILETIEKKDISQLNSSVKDFTNAYKDLKAKHTKLAGFSSYHYNIWNGAFAQYKLSAKNFIEKEYDLALKLGDYIVNKAKLANNFATDEQEEKDINIYTNYQMIKVFGWYEKLYMQGIKGQYVNPYYCGEITEDLQICWTTMSKDNQTISKEKAENFTNICKAMDNQRKICEKALSKISIYDFIVKYNFNIDAYSRKLKNALIYANVITDFNETFMPNYYNWINANVKA